MGRERDAMTGIDRSFYQMAQEIQSLGEKELYHRMRRSFEAVPAETQKSCADFFNQFLYWGRLDPANGVFEEIEWKQQALTEHMEDFIWVYERLDDYRSKKTLYAILNNWYCYDFATPAQARETLFESYFDLVSCTSEEVVVDLGAYTGDTALSYLRNYGEDGYKKMYCYEITPSTFEILVRTLAPYRDIDCRLKGVGDAEGVLHVRDHQTSASGNALDVQGGEAVAVTTLDADIREPVTLIKADIEGYEQKALLGARGHIVREHPKLLFSVYHNNEDLWKIPRMIHEMSPDYKFYLRFDGSPIYPTEITLFAL